MIKKILHKKMNGIIDQYLPTLMSILAMLLVTLFFINAIGDINTTQRFHQVARQAILRMESEGGLTDAVKNLVVSELSGTPNVDAASIKVEGSDTATTSYGDPIYITISADVNVTSWTNDGGFPGQIGKTDKKTITVTKQSTAKY